MIHTAGLTKRFGDLLAVDQVSLDIREGEIFGFLGPNGAGKTTTIRMLAGLISISGGTAEVAGCDVGSPADSLRLRQRIGFLPENVGLYENSTAYENLDYFAKLYGLGEQARREGIARVLRKMDLWEKRDLRVGSYSKGMKQKVALARALIHDPLLVFLDEPTANLDPEAAKMVRELILELKKEGRTIFLNTHHLDEAQRVCDRVGILRTRLLTVGSPDELRARLWGSRTTLRVDRVTDAIVSAVRSVVGAARVELSGDALIIDVHDPDEENPKLVEAVVRAGGRVRQLSQLSPSLEDVYLGLVHAREGGS